MEDHTTSKISEPASPVASVASADIAAEFAALTTEEQEKQHAEWSQELARVEEEINTLRTVLASKTRHASDLKRKLGITMWKEITDDMNQGLKNVKESSVYQSVEQSVGNLSKAVHDAPIFQRTESVLKTTSEKTAWAFGSITSGITSKFSQMKNSESMRSIEEKVGSAYENVKNRGVFWCSLAGTTIGVGFFVKDLMQGEKFKSPVKAENKVVIVTGANTGIGKETARELAKRGATVYMACRDMQKCEEAREEIVLESYNKHVYCRQCDLASMESIRKFVESFKREQQRLDVLINNAGVMRCPRSLTKDGFEMQLGVNHMGHFLLTNLLLDLLKKSAPSRIVTVSSLAHTRGEINIGDLNSDNSYDPGAAYNQSKLANILFTRELARRLQGTGVTANALHPGVVDTELFRHMGFFNSFFASILVKPLFWPFVKSPQNGAQTTLYAALDPELANVSGQYFSDCNTKDVAPAALDDSLAKWLWAVSEKWTKLNT